MASTLSSFRALLRASRVAFAGDDVALRAAAQRIRAEYETHRGVTDAAKLKKLHKTAKSAAELLVNNVAQAHLTERGTYELRVDPKRHEINTYTSEKC